jgi:hypothetical protein
LSRGRSTPIRRAIRRLPFVCSTHVAAALNLSKDQTCVAEVSGVMRPRLPSTWRCSAKSPGPRPPTEGELEIAFERAVTLFGSCSALPLLVAGIFANHHHATVPADHLALVTDLLDARLDLHRASFLIRLGMRGQASPWWMVCVSYGCGCDVVTCAGKRCGRESGHRRKVRRRLGPPEGCGCSAAASCH